MKKQQVKLTLDDINKALLPASENAMDENAKSLCELLGLAGLQELPNCMRGFALVVDGVASESDAVDALKTALFLYALAHTEEVGADWSDNLVSYTVSPPYLEDVRTIALDNFGMKVHCEARDSEGEKHGNYYLIVTEDFVTVELW